MARIVDDGGEMLDKHGKPVPTKAHVVEKAPEAVAQQEGGGTGGFGASLNGPAADQENSAEAGQSAQNQQQEGLSQGPTLPARPVFQVGPSFMFDASTAQRSMEPWELVQIMNVLCDGNFRVVIGEDKFRSLSPDVRQHFKKLGQ